jgi:hypothetical protein
MAKYFRYKYLKKNIGGDKYKFKGNHRHKSK